MIRRIFFLILGVITLHYSFAQGDGDSIHAAWSSDFDKAKTELRQISGQNATAYAKVGRALESLAIQNPGSAEAWYFLGCAIDRFNTSSGEEIPSSSLLLAERASACFRNCLDLSDGKYQGDVLLLDPHTRILSVWGAQAFRYLSNGARDSAVWCLKKAETYGGIDGTVSAYFKQVLDECSDSAYLFTNGDMYLYYLAYLQYAESYRPDIHCISLNFLNTQWYPQWLLKSGKLAMSVTPEALSKIQNKKWKAKEISLSNQSEAAGDSTIAWTLNPSDGEYLLRSDLILKDFIEQNAFKNNIFFPADVPDNMRLSLTTANYAQLRGLTLKIVPQKNSTSLSFLQNRLSELNEITTDDTDYTNNPDDIQVLNNYRFAYTAAADFAVLRNDPEAARNIILYEEKKYPQTLLPFYATATQKWFEAFKQKILETAINK